MTERGIRPGVAGRVARIAALLGVASLVAACNSKPPALEPEETFHWVSQPIAFSPPQASRWERQGDNGGGMHGVRFILLGGRGQCITVAAYTRLAERDRRAALAALMAGSDSLPPHEFVRALSLARPPQDDAFSEPEALAARQIGFAIDAAIADHLAGRPSFAAAQLQRALQVASEYEMSLDELVGWLPSRPERAQHPQHWRSGFGRDTTLAGYPAWVADDTLVATEVPLLVREIHWVVGGRAFKASYQGTPEHTSEFSRLVDSIRFPEDIDVTAP